MDWRETSNGYVACYLGGGKIYQHRWVWEQAHGPIPAGFHIHHKDRNRQNNRLENLVLCRPKAHRRHHNATAPRVMLACEDCGAVVTRIQNDKRPPVCRKCQSRRAEARRKVSRVCAYCGKTFVSRKGAFCSQRCVNLGARWHGVGA